MPAQSRGAPPVPSGGARTRHTRSSSTSRYIGVSWHTGKSIWRVALTDTQTKRQRHVGYFASEEDAARAYDHAAVQARGPGADRNFPCEGIPEHPVALSEERKKRKSLRYVGVSWHTATSSWRVDLSQAGQSQFIGSYASEDDAARAYDFAAVQARGPGAKRNFPGEVIVELPVSVSEDQKQRKSSRYIGVCWHKARSSWRVRLQDPQAKRSRFIGYFTSEEDAAMAYDFAAVQAHGPGVQRNFPVEVINELPVTVGEQRNKSSRYRGVSWHKAASLWRVTMWDPQTKRSRFY
ncbi:hypothetical protein FOA52_008623 [Chlamydomonas sp. UWO 241]|nr:hypothetical protein FOA52_008623 [Chlamydomonas sp. UWO 241]